MRIALTLAPIFLLNLAANSLAQAAPYVPAEGRQIIERLPDRNDPRQRELKDLRARLAATPDDPAVAAQMARRHIEAARADGDPRYLGYAQAALAPWWQDESLPPEVRLLRATLRQSQHQFVPALADLDVVLRQDPRNAQALLTRATVLQVQGRFDDARQSCLRLYPIAPELVSVACVASVTSLTGQARQSHALLRAVLDRDRGADAGTRAWALTLLAEMARRMGDAAAAERHFREALATEKKDAYLLGAYADFLLEQGRSAEVLPLLKNQLRVDALLLRYAEALKALRSPEADRHIAMVGDRFRAADMRGDTVHLREQARYALRLQGDARQAVQLAQRNWAVQKEPADALILLEAARAARDDTAARQMTDWVRQTGLQDPAIARLGAQGGDLP